MFDNISTKTLVEELSKREGVIRFDVLPHSQTVEIDIYDREYGTHVHDEIEMGPCIVLQIID